jgi:hypothetical protein
MASNNVKNMDFSHGSARISHQAPCGNCAAELQFLFDIPFFVDMDS